MAAIGRVTAAISVTSEPTAGAGAEIVAWKWVSMPETAGTTVLQVTLSPAVHGMLTGRMLTGRAMTSVGGPRYYDYEPEIGVGIGPFGIGIGPAWGW